MLYTLVAWFVLANGVNSSTFFGAVFLFVSPILMDAARSYVTERDGREYVLMIELVVCSVWCLIAILGLLGVFIIDCDSSGTFFVATSSSFVGFQFSGLSISDCWYALGSIWLLTLIDLFYKPRLPKRGRSK